MKGDRDLCLSAGMDAYISKPIRAAELYQTIDDLMGRRRSAAAADEPSRPAADNEFDWSVALATVQGSEELLREIIEAFLEETPRQLSAVHKALAESDAPAHPAPTRPRRSPSTGLFMNSLAGMGAFADAFGRLPFDVRGNPAIGRGDPSRRTRRWQGHVRARRAIRQDASDGSAGAAAYQECVGPRHALPVGMGPVRRTAINHAAKSCPAASVSGPSPGRAPEGCRRSPR